MERMLTVLGFVALHTVLTNGNPLPKDCHDMYKYWDPATKDCQPCDFGPCVIASEDYNTKCPELCPGYWEELQRIEREGLRYHERQEREKRSCHDMYKYFDEQTNRCEPCDFGPCVMASKDYDTKCPELCPAYWDELKRIERKGIEYHKNHGNDPPVRRSHGERTREMMKVVFSLISVLVALGAGVFGMYITYIYCIQRFECCQRSAPPSWIHRYECDHVRTVAEGREPDGGCGVPKGVEAKESYEFGSNSAVHKFPNAKEPLLI